MKPIEPPHNREAAAIIAASRLKSKEEMQVKTKTNAAPYSDCQDLIITLENAEKDAQELNALLKVCYCAAEADKSGDFAHDIARSVGVLSAMSDNLIAGTSAAVRKAREIERSVGWVSALTGRELAGVAALTGGDGLRRYCDYLKAHGYEGDPHRAADALKNTSKRVNWAEGPRVDWAAGTAYEDCVKDDNDLRAFMLDSVTGRRRRETSRDQQRRRLGNRL